jgi:hypothetical protein
MSKYLVIGICGDQIEPYEMPLEDPYNDVEVHDLVSKQMGVIADRVLVLSIGSEILNDCFEPE